MSITDKIIYIDGERYISICNVANRLNMDRDTLYNETKGKPYYGLNRKLYLGVIVCFKESEVRQAEYKMMEGNRFAVTVPPTK